MLLGSGSLYQEAGYVGLSRGRHDDQLFLTDQTDDLAYTDDDTDHPRTLTENRPNATTVTAIAWQRTRAQTTARDLSRQTS
jgi:hypothetical protein